MKADGLFVITAIIFIFVAWVATGGPTRPISSAGLFITPVARPGEESQGYRTLVPANPIDSSSYPRQIAGGPAIISRGPDSYTRSANAGDSSYNGRVRLEHSTLGPASGNPNQEYVAIVNSGAADVSITGWRLSSRATGDTAFIPGGAELYRAGSVNGVTSVVLHSGDKAVVLSGRSPVGASFRENMCTGYLAQYQPFFPPLTQNCPFATTDVDRFYQSGDQAACSASAATIPRCAVVTSSRAGGSCRSFLQNTFNYNGCVALHQDESGFALPTWRIFLDRNLELWAKQRETITLMDQNGKVVDSFSY